MQARTLSAAHATQHAYTYGVVPSWRLVPHGECLLAPRFGLQPAELSSPQCESAAEAVPSAPHSCQANLCPTPRSHALADPCPTPRSHALADLCPTPRSHALANLCPTPRSHANTVLPLTQVLYVCHHHHQFIIINRSSGIS